MTVRQALRMGEEKLTEAGVPDPRLDAEYLLAFVLGGDRLALLLQASKELTVEQERRYSALLLSRTKREPLQYLLGTQYFYGRPFRVDERVLIPRQETELLCEKALEALKKSASAKVLDLCTGSGAIAVTLAAERPDLEVSACDLSGGSLALAAENAALNGARVHFFQGDLFQAVPWQRFTLIASNPPYIPRKDCASLQPEVQREPLLALDGGEDGLDFYRRIAKEAPDYLEEGGFLLLETGFDQAEAVSGLLRENGFENVAIDKDLYQVQRVVSGRCRGRK